MNRFSLLFLVMVLVVMLCDHQAEAFAFSLSLLVVNFNAAFSNLMNTIRERSVTGESTFNANTTAEVVAVETAEISPVIATSPDQVEEEEEEEPSTVMREEQEREAVEDHHLESIHLENQRLEEEIQRIHVELQMEGMNGAGEDRPERESGYYEETNYDQEFEGYWDRDQDEDQLEEGYGSVSFRDEDDFFNDPRFIGGEEVM
jgi:hypothetical protein